MPSSASSTASSDGSYLTSSARKMAYPKSHMEIKLKNHFRSKVYNTGSAVEGEVTITTQRDVRFDSVQIILLGLARTRLEGVSVPQNTTHTLLKLAMPVPDTAYPVPRVFEAGHTYRVPFNFVVPSHLTIGACGHRVDADHVRDHHLCLPPTMGFWERDDMAPDTARVEYSVKARVLREADADPHAVVKVMETTEQIRVLPAFAELPPLDLAAARTDRLYRMTKAKTLRRNLLSSKIGTVTASAAQPGAIVLSADSLRVSETTASVQLVFEPSSADSLPPSRVTAVSGKMSAHTFYSASPMATLADLPGTKQFVVDRRATYSSSVPLFSTSSPEKLVWQQRLRSSARRDSGYSSGEPPADDSSKRRKKQKPASSSTLSSSSSSSGSSPVYYSCTIEVPIRLPEAARRAKTFIPTFHSCLLSRVYVLQMSLTLGSSSPSSTSGLTTLTLSLPLQVAAEPGDQSLLGPTEQLPDFETALEEAEADEHLRPRTMAVPAPEFRETSVLPAYC